MGAKVYIVNKSSHSFWNKVNVRGVKECWEWQGSRNSSGYGYSMLMGEWTGVHRISWILANGQIPQGRHILHRCDNKVCCNPNHLYCGTQVDNMADKVARSTTPTKNT